MVKAALKVSLLMCVFPLHRPESHSRNSGVVIGDRCSARRTPPAFRGRPRGGGTPACRTRARCLGRAQGGRRPGSRGALAAGYGRPRGRSARRGIAAGIFLLLFLSLVEY